MESTRMEQYMNPGEVWSNSLNYLSNRPVDAVARNWQTYEITAKASDYWVRNASFLKCDNITLGYSFSNLFKNGSYRGLNGRVYGTVSNVFTISNYDGIDPEINNGFDNNLYPRPISFIIGLNEFLIRKIMQYMKKYIKNIVPATFMMLALGATSCIGDLDVDPIDPNIDTNVDLNGLFNKCYANMALAGNGGANGDCDIDGLDGGTTGFIRQLFNSNELTTDEAICGWGDEGVASFCYNTYNASHPMLNGFYARLTTGITYCNQYLAMAGDTDATMSAEIRFVRALHYFLLMDGWGNIPFTLEPMTKPEQRSRAQMYEWLEQELIGIEPALSEAKAKKSTDAGYGRVDKAACWLLLSRLYLNSEIYTGTAQWQKAKEYADKVIKSSYRLNTVGKGGWTAYQMLFMGDNGETDAAYEALLPLLQDGLTTTSWGTSLFLIAGCFDGEMHANPNDLTATNGVSAQNWGGNRARPDLIRKFFPQNDAPELPSYDMYVAAKDDRALFDGVGRTLNNEDVSTFKSGYAIAKFTNFKTDGSAGHDATFADTDYFLLRVAEAYLTFAEADARLNGGNTTSEGTQAVNSIRSRAHASTRTNAYSLDDICDEWSREFYFEGRRRMDLIRFNRYGGNNNYTWQWKGGSYEGRSFDAHLNIFAIPTNELTANSNLTQNPGY